MSRGTAHLTQVPSFVYFPVYCIARLFVWVFSFGPLSQHFPDCAAPLGPPDVIKRDVRCHIVWNPRFQLWASAISGANENPVFHLTFGMKVDSYKRDSFSLPGASQTKTTKRIYCVVSSFSGCLFILVLMSSY